LTPECDKIKTWYSLVPKSLEMKEYPVKASPYLASAAQAAGPSCEFPETASVRICSPRALAMAAMQPSVSLRGKEAFSISIYASLFLYRYLSVYIYTNTHIYEPCASARRARSRWPRCSRRSA